MPRHEYEATMLPDLAFQLQSANQDHLQLQVQVSKLLQEFLPSCC